MLVLSRREGEKIVFPTIGITIEVLRIRGNTSRLGIDAPSDVKVLRNELAPAKSGGAVGPPLSEIARLRHNVLNHLNAANLALALYRRYMDSGRDAEAAATFQKVIEEFEALEREAVSSRSLPGTPAAARLHRALVVEDDANECELLAGFLRLSGFEVATAGDGSGALDYLASHQQPDVVLLDMLMPRCDGPTTIGRIRSAPEYCGLKVFAISGTSPSNLGVVTGPAGVDKWFRKPVKPEDLVAEIHRDLAGTTHVA
jgi:carbon storage regulator CsrA